MDRSIQGEHRPELISRRGEFIAWGLTALLAATIAVMYLMDFRPPGVVVFLAAFFLASALSISLGNWMDRRTLIRLDPDRVSYENGLRHTDLAWEDIREIQVFPSAWGKKVRVIGEKAYFAFRTLGEVKVQGELKGRMGFTEGDKILRYILEASGLKAAPSEGPGNARYYRRQ